MTRETPATSAQSLTGKGLTVSQVSARCISQPGGKEVPGDLFSGAPSPELGRTSRTQLTGEGKSIWTGLCSVGVLTSLGTKASVLSPSSLTASVGTAASHVPVNFPSPQHRHQTSSSLGLLSCPRPPWAAVLATTVPPEAARGLRLGSLPPVWSEQQRARMAATLGSEHP